MIGPYKLNTLYVGDSLELTKSIPDESVDITITSPPYNLGSRYANVTKGAIQGKWGRVIQYDAFQDNLSDADYVIQQQTILRELWRITKPTGAIYYNHKPRIQKGKVDLRFQLIPQEVNIRQLIVWQRPKGHNFNRGYYVPSYEWIFLLAKPNYQLKPKHSGLGDVWYMKPSKKDHPAPFPIELPRNAIQCSEFSNVVFDPYMGSGTTAEAAIELGCNWLGFELIESIAEGTRNTLNERL